MTELMVAPYRDDDEKRADEFFSLLSTYPNLAWIPADMGIANLAAQVRARYGLRTPDALQAATAIATQSSGLITNDAVFERVEGFETMVLDRLR